MAFGQALGQAVNGLPGVIFLDGGLGAGKTTLARALIQALGVQGRVVSPTYTLMEPYNAGPNHVLHLDLYRLDDPGELEYLGLRDFDPDRQLMLVEWPEKGLGMLPEADLVLALEDDPKGRQLGAVWSNTRGKQWWQHAAITMSQ